MQPLQICIGPTIRIGRESWCLPYAGFFLILFIFNCHHVIDKYTNGKSEETCHSLGAIKRTKKLNDTSNNYIFQI